MEMRAARNRIRMATVLIVLGLAFMRTLSMFPAPLLITIGAHFGITNDALLNLAVNIVFIFIVVGCIAGMFLEGRVGIRRLYSFALLSATASSLVMVFGARAYIIVLIGRSLLGLGLGFSVPFFGSAIMRWFHPLQREKMDTFNGLLPFFGPLISYVVAVPLSRALGGHWELSMAIWGIPIVITLILWSGFIGDDNLVDVAEDAVGSEGVSPSHSWGLVKELVKRREMRLLILATVCDYSCYSYMGTILPLFLAEVARMDSAQANLVAAFIFPAIGVVGIFLSGFFLTKVGLRKPLLVFGQYGEVCGLLIAAIGANRSLTLFIIGVGIFALANALWTPALYVVPHDLPGMDPARAGVAFALIGILGESFSFLAPLVGGLLTGLFLTIAGQHVVALSWSLVFFACFNVLGAIAVTLIPETGEKRLGKGSAGR